MKGLPSTLIVGFVPPTMLTDTGPLWYHPLAGAAGSAVSDSGTGFTNGDARKFDTLLSLSPTLPEESAACTRNSACVPPIDPPPHQCTVPSGSTTWSVVRSMPFHGPFVPCTLYSTNTRLDVPSV